MSNSDCKSVFLGWRSKEPAALCRENGERSDEITLFLWRPCCVGRDSNLHHGCLLHRLLYQWNRQKIKVKGHAVSWNFKR